MAALMVAHHYSILPWNRIREALSAQLPSDVPQAYSDLVTAQDVFNRLGARGAADGQIAALWYGLLTPEATEPAGALLRHERSHEAGVLPSEARGALSHVSRTRF